MMSIYGSCLHSVDVVGARNAASRTPSNEGPLEAFKSACTLCIMCTEHAVLLIAEPVASNRVRTPSFQSLVWLLVSLMTDARQRRSRGDLSRFRRFSFTSLALSFDLEAWRLPWCTGTRDPRC